jgi:hypothetical protein
VVSAGERHRAVIRSRPAADERSDRGSPLILSQQRL